MATRAARVSRIGAVTCTPISAATAGSRPVNRPYPANPALLTGRSQLGMKAGRFRRAGQALGRELADRLPHQVARRPRRPQLAKQAVVHQLLQAIQHRSRVCGHRQPAHRAGASIVPFLPCPPLAALIRARGRGQNRADANCQAAACWPP